MQKLPFLQWPQSPYIFQNSPNLVTPIGSRTKWDSNWRWACQFSHHTTHTPPPNVLSSIQFLSQKLVVVETKERRHVNRENCQREEVEREAAVVAAVKILRKMRNWLSEVKWMKDECQKLLFVFSFKNLLKWSEEKKRKKTLKKSFSLERHVSILKLFYF